MEKVKYIIIIIQNVLKMYHIINAIITMGKLILPVLLAGGCVLLLGSAVVTMETSMGVVMGNCVRPDSSM